ncbi:MULTISPECIES: hypothetical protein [Vibrio]|uniref:hypothetical protein n=1 Tax=Vibrio TaxID=662 RepID=UPI000C84DAE4|nr:MULTISPECIES: hypothetical protein [Vibrio]MCW4447332.1 hypothetical protein [Vibrio splendidus]MDH5932370.1 hypothetical protein [Vibrio splendidus]PML74669.1 hypothetical protein BCT71_05235 [Vibrio sp. 10N.261.51.A7]
MKKTSLVICATVALISQITNAATLRNDVPSCTSEVPAEYYQLPNDRELVILLDKTMAHSLDQGIKSELYQSVKRFIQPGDKVQLVEFSSFAQDSYTKVTFNGQLDTQLSDEHRSYVKKSVLKSLDKCLDKQHNFMLNKVGISLKTAFQPQEKPTNTELVGALSDISSQVLTQSTAKRKVVLLISDMLENSDITSFYKNNKTRVINPQQELKRVSASQMFANFNQADIYVIGTGVIPGNQQYISAQKMSKLESFWKDYFKQSNATLLGFGKPMLLGDIR